MMIRISLVLMGLLFANSLAQAQMSDYKVTKSAKIYDAPDGNAVGTLPIGRKIKAEPSDEYGYLKLKTNSGKNLYIRGSDTKPLAQNAADDVASGDSGEREPAQEENYHKLTYDLGFSTGRSGGISYTEANIGFNYFFKHWLAWRNAVFARFVEPKNIFGLDTSLRLFQRLPIGETSGLTLFAGPGYRFQSEPYNVPFVEGGLVVRLSGLNIGGGFKTFFYDTVKAGLPKDTQYFIILSGGGAL